MNDPKSANLFATINFAEGGNKIKSNRIRVNFAQGYSTLVKEIEYAARQCPTDDGFLAEKITISFGDESFLLSPDFNKNAVLGKLLLPNKDKLKINIDVIGSTVKPKGLPQRSNSRASMMGTESFKAPAMVRAKKSNVASESVEHNKISDESGVPEAADKIITEPVAPAPVVAAAPLAAPAPAPVVAQVVTASAEPEASDGKLVVVREEIQRLEAVAVGGTDKKADKAVVKSAKKKVGKFTWKNVRGADEPTDAAVSDNSDCESEKEASPVKDTTISVVTEPVEAASLAAVVKVLDFEPVAAAPIDAPQTPVPAPAAAAPEPVAETPVECRVPAPSTSVIALDSLRSPEASRTGTKLRVAKNTSTPTMSRSRSANRTRIASQETPASTPIYNSSLGSTAGEVALSLQNQLRHTTGSAALAQATAAAFQPNATMSSMSNLPSATKAPIRSTPAKKVKSGNTATHELSPLSLAMSMPSASKGKKNVEGRPSIGTMGDQWEFMRSNFFNNNDEEIVWAMVSRKGGACHHARKKQQAAEDRYFQCMFDISTLDAKVESLTSGPAARTVAMVMQLKDLCADFQAVPSAETIAKVDAVLEKMKGLVTSTTAAGESVLKVFCATTEAAIEAILATEDHGTLLRAARKLSGAFTNEQTYLRNQLKKANKDSEEALENMEKWARRERDANDYASTIRREEEDWLDAQLMPNTEALTTMRGYIPVNVTELSVAEIIAKSKKEGGLMSLELATEVKQNKLLHWLVTHHDDIVIDSFLIGDKKTYFDNFDQLDVVELRALAAIMPVKFENDKDGRKADWRARFFAKVKQMVSQQDGEKVKGCFDPALGQRAMVSQPALKPEQRRRPVYFYQTKEKSAQRVKQYNDRIALLARREAVLSQSEASAATAKEEYDIVLKEMRDPDFIAEYGVEVLARSKDAAKNNLTRATSALKSAQSDLANLKKTINDMPLSREQYLEQESEIAEFIQRTRGINWSAPKLDAVEIEGVFDPTLEIRKIEKASSKFVSAEEEAALRKQEMEQLLSRKAQSAAQNEQQAIEGEESARTSPVDAELAAIEDSAGVPATPMRAAATATAPNTEFRRLSVAQTGLFSPSAVRKCDLSGAAVDANGAEFATPRKRNSVLLNANPEMLNTLNRMLAASPSATPSKRQSLFPMASSSKLPAQSTDGEAQNEENKKPAKKVQTRSAFVKQMMNPGGSQSPKRSALGDIALGTPSGAIGGPPKLNFLAQLTARVKTTVDNAGNAGNAGNMAAEVTKSITTTAKSLFADIARFRKSDDNEVAVVGTATASAEDKENSVRPSAPAAPTMGGLGGLGGMPRMAMSMFDEIRKRRVIE